jgi:hypothetical protein
MKKKFLENQTGYSGKVQSLWGIPVMYFENAFSLKPAELEIIKNLEFDNSDDQNNLVKTSKKKQLFKETIGLADVRDQINHYACKFIDEIICVDNKFEMVQSWVTKTRPGEEHPPHTHQGAIFSVVYYVDSEESEFRFVYQQNFLTKGFNFEYNIKNHNIFNSQEVTYKPRTGDILIAPGYVLHKAKNLGNKDKYVIGANYFIRGDVGNYENITIVKNI